MDSVSKQESTLNGVRVVLSAPAVPHTKALKGVTIKTSAPANAELDGQAEVATTNAPADKKM